MGWQEIIKQLETPIPAAEENSDEICQCPNKDTSLKFTGTDYIAEGNCGLSKICALIAKDKHRARISTSAFMRKKAYEERNKPKPSLMKLDKFFMGE